LGIDVREVPATPELLLAARESRQKAAKHHDTLTYGAAVLG
jgi:hypothetical protein